MFLVQYDISIMYSIHNHQMKETGIASVITIFFLAGPWLLYIVN